MYIEMNNLRVFQNRCENQAKTVDIMYQSIPKPPMPPGQTSGI